MSTIWLIEDGRRTPLPKGWDGLSGHRSEEWWSWLLQDRAGRDRGELTGVETGNLNINVNADTRGTGSLTWSGPLEEMPPWADLRIKPCYNVTLMTGETVQWPMGVYVPTSPSTTHHDGHVSCEVRLFDRTILARRQHIPSPVMGLPTTIPVIPRSPVGCPSGSAARSRSSTPPSSCARRCTGMRTPRT